MSGNKETIQYLTIVEECRVPRNSRKTGIPGYRCKCVCGNIKEVGKTDFNRNMVTSCGCMTSITISDKVLKEIVSGTVFGSLTVIERTDEKSTRGYKYKCQCNCGKITYVFSGDLKRGDTKSCGCKILDNMKGLLTKKKKEYIGKVFGYLEIIDIKRDENNKKFIAICMCSGCDIITEQPINALERGVKSCGCKTSEMQSVTRGGTGIPYENVTIQRVIRESSENRQFVVEALKKANFKCAITGVNSNRLEVHHIVSLSSLIRQYSITKDNWKAFSSVLFDLKNAVVFEKKIHAKFHKIYKYETNREQLLDFMSSYKTN